jgi:ABC-type uncharacterized transport system substrate-binding protein
MMSKRDQVRNPGRRPLAAWLCLLGAALPLPQAASAHPHVFIDGGVDFVMDASGDLAALRITWIYDPLASLFLLEDLGIASLDDSDLTPDLRARLAAAQTDWIEGYDGDSYLWHDGARVPLSGPADAAARIEDGRVVYTFLRELGAPLRPGADTTVEIYDPTYYTAYAVTREPAIEGPSEGCAAEIEPFEPTPLLARLQENLAAIPADGTPEDPQIGARFAEKVHLRCD